MAFSPFMIHAPKGNHSSQRVPTMQDIAEASHAAAFQPVQRRGSHRTPEEQKAKRQALLTVLEEALHLIQVDAENDFGNLQ